MLLVIPFIIKMYARNNIFKVSGAIEKSGIHPSFSKT